MTAEAAENDRCLTLYISLTRAKIKTETFKKHKPHTSSAQHAVRKVSHNLAQMLVHTFVNLLRQETEGWPMGLHTSSKQKRMSANSFQHCACYSNFCLMLGKWWKDALSWAPSIKQRETNQKFIIELFSQEASQSDDNKEGSLKTMFSWIETSTDLLCTLQTVYQRKGSPKAKGAINLPIPKRQNHLRKANTMALKLEVSSHLISPMMPVM